MKSPQFISHSIHGTNGIFTYILLDFFGTKLGISVTYILLDFFGTKLGISVTYILLDFFGTKLGISVNHGSITGIYLKGIIHIEPWSSPKPRVPEFHRSSTLWVPPTPYKVESFDVQMAHTESPQLKHVRDAPVVSGQWFLGSLGRVAAMCLFGFWQGSLNSLPHFGEIQTKEQIFLEVFPLTIIALFENWCHITHDGSMGRTVYLAAWMVDFYGIFM